jgi:two-component system response regulator NreC
MAIESDSRTGGERLRVLLAMSDFPMLVVGLRAIIDGEPDMVVVGELGERESLPDVLTRIGTDVLVTEHLPFNSCGRTTLETIETIRQVAPDVRILAWACRSSSEQFSLALKAGADGFLTREAAPSDVVAAIRCVSRGQTYVSPAIVTRMVNTYLLRTPQGSLEDPYDMLSDREQEVLLLAAVGHTNREIARTLHLREQAVHSYRAGLMEKLGFHDRVDLLKFAIRRGVISVADL